MADRDEITQSYLDALEALRGLAIRDLNAWWKDTQYHDFITQRDLMRSPFNAIIKTYGAQTAHAAADYLFMKRGLDDTLRGLPYPTMAEPVTDERIEAAYQNVMWVKDLGEPGDRAAALSKLQALTKRLVVDPANETVYRATKSAGTAYARLPDPGCCAWCLMLASQGAVYHTGKTALIAKSGKRYHDGCRCVAIEVNKAAGERSPKVVQEARGAWKDISGRLGGKVPTMSQWKAYLELRKADPIDPKAAENTWVEFGHEDEPRNRQVYRLPSRKWDKSIVEWQDPRTGDYHKVQAYAEGKESSPRIRKIYDDLVEAAEATPLKSDVVMWRGLGDFGLVYGDVEPEELAFSVLQQRRFTAVTTKQSTAKGFAHNGPAPVILKVTVRKGTPGIWMPTNAAESMAYEQELLIPPGVDMTIVSVKRLDDGTVSIEVII